MATRLTALVMGLVLWGCAPTLYAPNQVAAPLLREAGELKASLAVGNAQLAYAPVDGVGLLANGFYERGTIADTEEAKNGGWLVEAAGGVFGELLLHNLRWELYAGAGYGQATGQVRTDTRDARYTAPAVRAFVQPNVGYVSPYFEVSASLRTSGVKYLDVTSTGYTQAQLEEEFLVPGPVVEPVWFFLEPSVTIKLGYKWLKVFFQQGWALKLNGGELPYKDTHATVGVMLDLASWYHTFQWTRPVELAAPPK